MNTLRNLLLIGLLASLLGGCVLAISDDGDMHHGHWDHDYYSDSSKSDRDLAQAVRSSLDSNSQTRNAAISVHAHDGKVTLQGTVNDPAIVGQAVTLASGTTGVRKVICEIVVLKD